MKIRELKTDDLFGNMSMTTSLVPCNIKSPYKDCCIGCPFYIDGKSLCREIVAILDREVELNDK